MSGSLSHNLEKLKTTFQNILLLRNDVSKTKDTISKKILQLKSIYAELSKNTTKKVLLFSLDSFFFQFKLFSVELENMDKFRILLNNRMYCDYYKLFTLIATYIKDNKEDLNAEKIEFRTFPVYKDLEPFQEYNLDDIKNIHNDIMKHINFLYECYQANEDKIINYNKKTRIGFSISNLLNTLEHENTVLKQQIALYVNYLSFFHISQSKHLKNLLGRLKGFDEEIEENVNGNHTYSVDDVEDTEPFRKFEYEPSTLEVSTTLECPDLDTNESNDIDTSEKPVEKPVEKNDTNTDNITLTFDDTDNTILETSNNNVE